MRATFASADQRTMRAALHRPYALATTLLTMSLDGFEVEAAGLSDTEVDRLARVRFGQDHFRCALLGC